VAGGVAWARASFTAPSVTIVKAWSLLSIMCPIRPQGLLINVGRMPASLTRREREQLDPEASFAVMLKTSERRPPAPSAGDRPA
jgi:hypothetical protein